MKIVLHKQLLPESSAMLLRADHLVKEAVSSYAMVPFKDGASSGPAGFALQIAVRIRKAMGKGPDEYTDSEAMAVATAKLRMSERLAELCSPENAKLWSKRGAKDACYAIIEETLIREKKAGL